LAGSAARRTILCRSETPCEREGDPGAAISKPFHIEVGASLDLEKERFSGLLI
jgi:hypothetical protein